MAGSSIDDSATVAAGSSIGRKKAFFAALLFLRSLSSFQTAILLAERGRTQDARTITRSCYETLFCFGALHKDPGFLEKFEKADLYSRKFANRFLADSKLGPEVAEKANELLNNLKQSSENGASLNIQQTATSAGLDLAYDVFYRGLSIDAAHPSPTALKRYYVVDENQDIRFRYEPDVTDVEDTLIASCTACLKLVERMGESVEHSEIKERLGRCSEEYNRLIEVAKAADASRE